MQKEYALYKGDTLLDIGTIKALAEKYKVKKETLYYYTSPTHKKRDRKGKRRVLIKLD